MLRCVSLAVVFDFSPFFIFQVWLIRSLLRSNVQSSRIFVHGFAVYLVWCKSVCDVKPGLDPCPLLARSWNRWWLDFMTFIAYKKERLRSKRSSAFRTGAMIYWSEKYILGLGALSVFNNRHHCWWVCIHAVHTCIYRASIEIKATKIDNRPNIKKILIYYVYV